ncbi:cellulose synthase subunit BcsC [Planctomycetes bacterium Pla163]|uniref:Cellulose synthase subunit BcsC n=1 Tax=Rohdeia mirabilis TaxID=2528008 RepID=A0A518CXI0_9BACT|nr:cellulose synthase subunit BcsC [Planctomycetes bacterium Pla163]
MNRIQTTSSPLVQTGAFLRSLPIALLCATLGACATLGDGVPPVAGAVTSRVDTATSAGAPTVGAQEATSSTSDAVAIEAAAPGGGGARSNRSKAGRPADRERDARVEALWRDPEFQRRFQQSYVPLTEVEPSLTTDERERLQDVVALVLKGEEGLPDARRRLERMITPASSPMLHFWLGNIALQQDDTTQAETSYRAAVQGFPRFLRAWRALAFLQSRTGDFDGARASFAQVLQLGPADADTYGLMGIALSRTGDHVAAESAFRMASLFAPDTFDWKVGLADSLGQQRRYADAIAQFDALLLQRPDQFQLWLGQADAYLKSGNFEKAAENLEFVDELGGSTTQTLALLGEIYSQEQLYDLAAQAYVRAIDIDPKGGVEVAVAAARGLAERNANEAAAAIVEHVRSLGSDPLEGAVGLDVLQLRATIARNEGRRSDEREHLEELTRLDPLDGWALIRLGESFEAEGEIERARSRFDQARGMDGFEAAGDLALGRMLVRQGELEDGLAALERSQRAEPRDDVATFVEQVRRAARTAK